MDNRSVVKSLLLLAAATLVAAGCGSSDNSVMAHSDSEAQAISKMNAMTPEQQIDMIQKGPMPASAKGPMIQKIKDKYGIK
jgi:hypothetical protein